MPLVKDDDVIEGKGDANRLTRKGREKGKGKRKGKRGREPFNEILT
jgi:hypothetical protein